MEYNEIPTAIKVLTDESTRCNYILQHDIPRYRDNKTNRVKITVGDRTVSVDSEELETFFLKQIEANTAESKRLESIHETLQKVAVGLIN